MIKIKVLAVLAASLTLLLVLTIGESVAVEDEALGQGDATTSNVRPKSRLDKLMDWETYTKTFRKKYSSVEQQLVRQKIFMARVINVFKTCFKYAIYMLSYYTAINKFSDMSQAETKRMISGEKFVYDGSGFTDDTEAAKLLYQTLDDSDSKHDISGIEQELEQQKLAAIQEFEANKSKHKSNRKKRSTVAGPERRIDLSIDNLIRLDEDDLLEQNENLQMFIPSSNPDYVPVQAPVLDIDPHDRVHRDIPEDSLDKVSSYFFSGCYLVKAGFNKLISQLDNLIEGEVVADETTGQLAEKASLNDRSDISESAIVFKDWRDSECIGPIRNQEVCNCCYAMSATSFMEWALCMNQDHVLTPLSPQYIVSCGLQYRSESEGKYKLNGCEHGSSKHAIDFMKEYGLELESNIEYYDTETECPVEEFTPRKMKGYIRPNVNNQIRLSSKTQKLDLALNVGPVIVSMHIPTDFAHYAGGMIESCDKESGHSMLVVGTAMEDGVEYLIIKNSFGSGWGYNGYLKFKRSAVADCVKEFISPSVSFPSKKSKARRIKSYLALKDMDSSSSDDKIDDSDSDSYTKILYSKGQESNGMSPFSQANFD